MLQKTLVPLVLAAACVALPAQASEAIVKKARCVACHTVDQKRVGPPYKEVAAKYKGDAGAPARLFEEPPTDFTTEEHRETENNLPAASFWMLRLVLALMGVGGDFVDQ